MNAARVAIRNQTAFFQQQLGQVASEWKADETRVTFADFAISEKICSELGRTFADDQILSEESGPMDEVIPVDSRYTWILDPIDGTNNYALGLSSCAISLALLKQGVPVYGLIYDGSRDELIEGGPGHGLRINNRKFVPPLRPEAGKDQIVALHFPLTPNRASQLAPLLESVRIRSLGSSALHLAYVALWRLDGAIDEKVRVWDIAAAVALLEAGGRSIRYLSGSPFPMTTFALQGPYLQYVAGSPEFLTRTENWLG